MSKQIMEIKDFFKKVDVQKNIEMFLKENFVVNLDFFKEKFEITLDFKENF